MGFIMDGKIHPLNEDYAYICQNYDADDFDEGYLKLKFFKIYINYLSENIENYPEFIDRVIDKKYFIFIHKNPFSCLFLTQKGTFLIKFKRVILDNLTNRD